MEISTVYHGVRNYNEEDILCFHRGLPGFEGLKKFILFPVEENDVFSVLQSIEDESVGLIVTSPFNVLKDYEFKLEEEVIQFLKISSEKDVLVLNTVTLHSKVESITVNLKAPIIINIKESLGEQIILDNDEYQVKYPLFRK